MRIALIGYGRMGRMIEEIALKKGHEVVLRISTKNRDQLTNEALQKADVAIEFTSPHSAFNNVQTCLLCGVPVVCGSTGWNDRVQLMKDYCLQLNGSFLYASNFSIGVTIFFEINQRLASLMAAHNYNVRINEIHHTNKKDAPSGTAITLAEQIIEQIPEKTNWVATPDHLPSELVISSERIDPAPGTHQVVYSSEIDTIEIIHTAHSRIGFALGAIAAAEFIANRKGVFQMKDVLNF